jgi:elongation factor P
MANHPTKQMFEGIRSELRFLGFAALFIDGRLVDIMLPSTVTLEVVDSAATIRGGSDAAWKPARLDTGLEIMVPLFIAPGEKIRVDTTGRKYAGRESEGKK